MSYQRFRACILTSVVVILAAAQRTSAETAVMTFQCGTGRLDLKVSGAGDLTASGGRAVFTGANRTMLSDETGQPQTAGGTVTINMTGFNPSAVEAGGLAIVVTDGTRTVTATVTDIGEDGFPDVLLSDGENLAAVEFFAPNSATNFMTFQYNPVSDTASVTIQGFAGDTATLTDVMLGELQMGVSATSSVANFNDIAFAATEIPLYPPLFNAANPWVDFAADPCGNGSEPEPFDLLADAVTVADGGATVSIIPGTPSNETFVDDSAIDTSLILTNAEPGNGSVSIGVTARRAPPVDRAKTGFVSRPRR